MGGPGEVITSKYCFHNLFCDDTEVHIDIHAEAWLITPSAVFRPSSLCRMSVTLFTRLRLVRQVVDLGKVEQMIDGIQKRLATSLDSVNEILLEDV